MTTPTEADIGPMISVVIEVRLMPGEREGGGGRLLATVSVVPVKYGGVRGVHVKERGGGRGGHRPIPMMSAVPAKQEVWGSLIYEGPKEKAREGRGGGGCPGP